MPSKTTRATLFGVPIVTAALSPNAIRPVNSKSAVVRGAGGTKKSSLLTIFPNGVLRAMRPDAAPGGTSVSIEVTLAKLRIPRVRLNSTLLLASVRSKFLPVMVTWVPAEPSVGLKSMIVGASGMAVTVKGMVVVAEPVGVVTLIGPDAAPVGTVVTICVAVAEMTVVGMPLNVTAFLAQLSVAESRAMYSD